MNDLLPMFCAVPRGLGRGLGMNPSGSEGGLFPHSFAFVATEDTFVIVFSLLRDAMPINEEMKIKL